MFAEREQARMAKFRTGQSGNPKGRPAGSKDRRTVLRALLEPHAPDIVAVCVRLAKDGEPTAMRLCMERMVAPVREEAVRFALPAISGAADCVAAQSALVAAVAAGELTPGQAKDLSSLVEGLRKCYETADLAKLAERLSALEEKAK
jgi:hypothetical protein